MKNHHPLPVILALLIIAFTSCQKEFSAEGLVKTTTATPLSDSFNLTINFTPIVDSMRLKLDSSYTNYWGEKYKVSAFKFYVSKFELINTDSGRTYPLDTSKISLVDASDSTTWAVKVLAAPFVYNRISFLIGIDSSHNVASAQTGALDPAKGMYISATGGYILAKLEGSSPLSAEANSKITYNIAGFSGANNALRKPTLLFPFGQYLYVSATAGSKSEINISADVNAWFSNPHQVKIANTASCTTPGLMAKDISENYSKMFSVEGIVNN